MFAVDPAEPAKVLAVLQEEETLKKRDFLGILTTHKHAYVNTTVAWPTGGGATNWAAD